MPIVVDSTQDQEPASPINRSFHIELESTIFKVQDALHVNQ